MSSTENDDRVSLLSVVVKHKNVSKVPTNSVVKKKEVAVRVSDTESEGDSSSTEEGGQHDMQILQELQKMNSRLQVVEAQMEGKQGSKNKQRYKGQKLSTVVKTCKKNCKKECYVNISSLKVW